MNLESFLELTPNMSVVLVRGKIAVGGLFLMIFTLKTIRAEVLSALPNPMY